MDKTTTIIQLQGDLNAERNLFHIITYLAIARNILISHLSKSSSLIDLIFDLSFAIFSALFKEVSASVYVEYC